MNAETELRPVPSASASLARPAAPLVPLFLVSASAVGFEVALTRYFAVANFSEYGYWVISIVMAGFALSGVALALARPLAVRHAPMLLRWLPVVLILAAAAGYHATTTNPFNPLQLQNQVTSQPQVWNIALYYAVLLPFFFLAGLYISLSFVLGEARIGRVYAADLAGAGVGSAVMLALMNWLHPFHLMAALLLPLTLAALWGLRPARAPIAAIAALAALLAGEALLLLDDHAAYNEFKAIYAPLHVPNSRTLAVLPSPRGLYQMLDDFTERVDTDVSNDSGMLGVAGPPQSFGLYRDGARIAALPRPPGPAAPYANGALEALPYALHPGARVLLVGASGGFRIAEGLALGAGHVTALEPDPVLRDALLHGMGPSPAYPADPRVTITGDSPFAAARTPPPGGYDLIDLSADFLDEAEANANAFTSEAVAADLRALAPGGVVSIPVSIREFPVYALRMLATARQALLAAGVADPSAHVVVYRSAWNVRILLRRDPWPPEAIAAVRKFCDDRSFDVSYYPGIDITAARAGIYNDLPAVSFDQGEVESAGGASDSIADEALAMLQGQASPSGAAFNLSPITMDRPFYYNLLHLSQLGTVLKRLEILPQAEIGALVNVAVLAQAVVLALLVLAVPLVGGRRLAAGAAGILRPAIYFPALGLGFLFIEIVLIGKASFYLNDRTTGFAVVLTGMLIFSGLGSLLADHLGANPRRALAVSVAVVVLWCAAMLAGLQPFLLATLDWSPALRIAAILVLLAPVSVALGLPFPLGLSRAAQSGSGFLPWAWGLNGAFSVVATPLANLLSLEAGFDRVLLSAGVLYVVALIAYPSVRKSASWQDISDPSRVVD